MSAKADSHVYDLYERWLELCEARRDLDEAVSALDEASRDCYYDLIRRRSVRARGQVRANAH